MKTLNRKQPEIVTITVRDMRRCQWFWQANEIMDQYLPLIGTVGYSIYSLYSRRAMSQSQSTKIPQEVIAQHLGIRKNSVSEYIKLLEWCGLIRVDRQHRSVSEVYLLAVKPLTPTVMAEIRERVYADMGGKDNPQPKFAKLSKSILSRLAEWRSLPDVISDHVDEVRDQKIVVLRAGEVEPPSQIETQCDGQGHEPIPKAQIPPDSMSEAPPLVRPSPHQVRPGEGQGEPPPQAVMTRPEGHETEVDPPPQPVKPPSPLPQLWAEAQLQLKYQLTAAAYHTFVMGTELLRIEDEVWVIGCRNAGQIEALEQRLPNQVARAVRTANGKETELKYIDLKK